MKRHAPELPDAPRQSDQGQGPRAVTGGRNRRIPSEGEHDTMKAARHPGCHSATSGHLLLWIPALALVSMLSGCAGWSSLGENRTGLTGAFWNRSAKATKAPGYDLYADSGAADRPQPED